MGKFKILLSFVMKNMSKIVSFCLLGFTDEKDGNIAENQKMIESQPTSGDAGASVKVKVFLDENKQQQMGNLMKLAASGISDTKEDDDNEENDLMLIKQTNVGSRRVSTGLKFSFA